MVKPVCFRGQPMIVGNAFQLAAGDAGHEVQALLGAVV